MKLILFNTEMVQAILEGRKTVTRRVVKLPSYVERQPNGLFTLFTEGTYYENQHIENMTDYLKPPYRVNDILYVRETWQCWRAHRYEATADIRFKAGGNGVRLQFANGNTDSVNRDDYDTFIHKWFSHSGEWKPSIHMPKEAARIFLKVTDVRVERLQDMKFEDALKEGAFVYMSNGYFDRNIVEPEAKRKFGALWDSTINKDQLNVYGWNANPYVWVMEFEKLECSTMAEALKQMKGGAV